MPSTRKPTIAAVSPGRGWFLVRGDSENAQHQDEGADDLGDEVVTVFRIAGAVQKTASFKFASSVSTECGRYAR
jgi:hypothetical protein